MPHLVQLLLPLRDNGGRAFEPAVFEVTRRELTDRFGGMTAHMRAPAKGLWTNGDGRLDHDDIVILEVMVDTFDRAWWREYRETLRRRFAQDELVVRILPIELP